MQRILILLSLPMLLGCAMDNRGENTASIDDGRTHGGFKIAAVDGNPPTRWQHRIHTVVPVVLVEPGLHTFTVEEDQDFQGVPPFVAEIEAGKKYRTEMQDGDPYLVEEVPVANPFLAEEAGSNSPSLSTVPIVESP